VPVALVTGTSTGIGFATALHLARHGHRVVATMRNLAKAGPLEEAARAESLPLTVRELDVTREDSIDRAVAATRDAEGPIDVLVNNAGVYTGPAREVWAVNVRGPLLLTRALAPKLAKGARVVMVTSGLGSLSGQLEPLARKLQEADLTVEDILVLCEQPPGGYGASKAALNALTRLFARELPSARVNAVCPGWVRTDMGGPGAPRSVAQGAASVLWGCRLPPDGPTGGVFRDGHAIPL